MQRKECLSFIWCVCVCVHNISFFCPFLSLPLLWLPVLLCSLVPPPFIPLFIHSSTYSSLLHSVCLSLWITVKCTGTLTFQPHASSPSYFWTNECDKSLEGGGSLYMLHTYHGRKAADSRCSLFFDWKTVVNNLYTHNTRCQELIFSHSKNSKWMFETLWYFWVIWQLTVGSGSKNCWDMRGWHAAKVQSQILFFECQSVTKGMHVHTNTCGINNSFCCTSFGEEPYRFSNRCFSHS